MDAQVDVSGAFRNVFTGESVSGPLRLSEVFGTFPVALLMEGQ